MRLQVQVRSVPLPQALTCATAASYFLMFTSLMLIASQCSHHVLTFTICMHILMINL